MLGSGCGDSQTVQAHFATTRPRRLTVEYAHKSPNFAPAITLAWRAPVDALRNEALAAARRSDMVLAFVGLNAWLEGEEMPVEIPGFAGGDRTDIQLPGPQRQLLDALEATGKPVIVVLQSGSAVPLGPQGEKARAIIQAGTGESRAVAPSPMRSPAPTIRRAACRSPSMRQRPAATFTDYSMKGRTYRYFSGTPEYPFGYGLSYTRFAYSDLRVGSSQLAAGAPQRLSVQVQNSGAAAGDEVVQLYSRLPIVQTRRCAR